MKAKYLECLEAGIQGIEWLRKAQPGAGPMTERIAARQKAREYLEHFQAIKTWPKRYQEQVREIDNAICSLV